MSYFLAKPMQAEKKTAQTPPAARQKNHIILARVLAGSRLRLLIHSFKATWPSTSCNLVADRI